MSVLTLTSPETRTQTSSVGDSDKVRVADGLYINPLLKTASFFYEVGRVVGSSFEVDRKSNVVAISAEDYDSYLGSSTSVSSGTLESNLEALLLQYLIDKSIVGAGTIA